MENLLTFFTNTITKEGNIFTICYKNGEYIGEVKYIEYPPTKYQKEIYLMFHSDMGDVIEWIHKKSPLMSGDLNKINMLIRTDSLDKLHKFILGPAD